MSELALQQIAQCRKKIDKIDSQIIKLLDERFSEVTKIGQLKKSCGLAIYDKNREASKLDSLSILAQQCRYLRPEHVAIIFETIFSVSRQAQAQQPSTGEQ